MPIQQTLERIQHDIDTGNLSKARDRLHGLISTYPDNLNLRKRLGDVYFRLQMPEMAGRYWYLEEDKNDEMNLACQIFEKSCKGYPLEILRALSFKGSLESIKEEYAGKKIQGLIDSMGFTWSGYRDPRRKLNTNQRISEVAQRKHKKQNKFFSGLLYIFIFLILLFAGIGVFTLIQWIFKL
jgi:hypothetical protein